MGFLLQDICRVQKGRGTFVGLSRKSGEIPQVIFPHGYRLPPPSATHPEETEAKYRACVLELLNVLKLTREVQQGSMSLEAGNVLLQPLWAYGYIIREFLGTRRYCSESAEKYKVGGRGSIHWGRTFRAVTPIYSPDGHPFYPRMAARELEAKQGSLLSCLHRYCVWESFQKMGWLFGVFLPPKEKLSRHERLRGISYLHRLRSRTHIESRNALYQAMIDILENRELPLTADTDSLSFGTYNFEHAWGTMIEALYGNTDRHLFYPRVSWHRLFEGAADRAAAAPLRPDTIMKVEDDIYILDAKYYQACDEMPGSSDVGKQYLYGMNAERLTKGRVYNAFLLPGSGQTALGYYHFAGDEAYVASVPYRTIVAIALDTRQVMEQFLYRRMEKSVWQQQLVSCIRKVLATVPRGT